MAISVLGTAQTVPEILYYKFDSGNVIPNEASTPPTGATSGTITGLTVGGTGLSGTALLGTGLTSTGNVVNTGWATNLTGSSWTIGFYTANVPASSILFYIFGDANAGGFRCLQMAWRAQTIGFYVAQVCQISQQQAEQ